MIRYALIVAGGSGSRMKAQVPKQFALLAGKPVLMHTMESFFRTDTQFRFILVLPAGLMDEWKSLCVKHKFTIEHVLAEGGDKRFYSVKNGLDKIKEEGIVFIHDGVRPLVSAKTIENCLRMAAENGNALPVIYPSESVRKIETGGNRAVNRNEYMLVQTPQTFKTSLIKDAYRQEYSDAFTDDASVLESAGYPIYLVEGNRENIKITWPEDLIIASAFIRAQKNPFLDAEI